MANGSIANNRHLQILDALYTAGNVTVNALEELLQVSKVTIRRDLDFLNDKGLLVRTHGGASLPPNQDIRLTDEDYAKKDIVHVQEKRRIAQKCASLLKAQDILFINSGSTTNLLLQSIAGKQIKVITNNAASLESPIDEKVEILFLGGEYLKHPRSFIGEFALTTLREMYSTHTILGTNGISLEKGLTTTVYQECSINQAMIQNTHGKVIVLADHTKMGVISNFISAPLESVDIVITDDKCPPAFKAGLEAAGIEVLIA
ncbi:MAG: DeoR/GlpR family DNA-binding transcription regulator [Sphaerochaeta sp.]|nr:DeoR/GlpR family DNA-binding transcription regulator [Sphaerochaeta sp.]